MELNKNKPIWTRNHKEVTEEEYKSLSGFVNSHHRNNGTYKHNGVSGWRCSECEMNDEWISTKTLLIQN